MDKWTASCGTVIEDKIVEYFKDKPKQELTILGSLNSITC